MSASPLTGDDRDPYTQPPAADVTLLPQAPILDARQINAFNNDHGLQNLTINAKKISACYGLFKIPSKTTTSMTVN